MAGIGFLSEDQVLDRLGLEPGGGGIEAPTTGLGFTPNDTAGTVEVITSDAVTVTGDEGTVWAVVVRGDGSPQLEINEDGDWTAHGAVRAGDTIKVRLTTGPLVSTLHTATVYLQDATLPWTVTTAADLDFAAFMDATGITDPTISDAVEALIADLKLAGLWTKMHAVYPFVGGTAGTHKFNLLDPQDTDAAFRLTYTGSPTHGANGFLPNMSGGYADTHFVPSTHLPAHSIHMSYYSRSNTAAGDKTEMGCYNWAGASGARAHMLIRYSGDLAYWGMNDGAGTNVGSQTTSQGFFASTRRASNDMEYYRNGATVASSAAAGTIQSVNSVWIGGINSYSSHTDRECAFASIGEGLTDAEMADLYTVVQDFQTALGRQV
jgi:hypothetical protein